MPLVTLIVLLLLSTLSLLSDSELDFSDTGIESIFYSVLLRSLVCSYIYIHVCWIVIMDFIRRVQSFFVLPERDGA